MADSLARAISAMVGEVQEMWWEPISGAAPLSSPSVTWRQSFENPPGSVSISVPRSDCDRLCEQILHSAGFENSGPETFRSTYLGLIERVIEGLTRHLASQFGTDILHGPGGEPTDEPGYLKWAIFHIGLADAQQVEITIGVDATLLDAVADAVSNKGPARIPKTLDRLLDVELPVSVSFGRAQIALKDALKLTTGSILELDRTIAEPVDVIVNNCAIARGEVVVVEGNFGVRILQVISRHERLKTVS
jgi:flagellar motor switch protein FliN/FliY